MLIQFNFKNFKSFRGDTSLDMSATGISEYLPRVFNVGNEKILPVAAIFGANAHGKSNIIEAFRYMNNYVINSLDFGGEIDNASGNGKFITPTPFLMDESSANAESLFEVYFIDSEEEGAKTFNYGFTVSKDGINEEWLNYKSKTSRGPFRKLFYRNEKEGILELDGIAKKRRENIEISLEKETLIVSLGSKLKIEKLKHIRDWFDKNQFADFGQPVENFFLSRLIPEGFVDDKEVQRNVLRYLSSFDESIVGFEVEKIPGNERDDYIRIEAVHNMIGSDKLVKIPLQNESSGTLKMFSLYPMLQKVMDKGGIFVVDELNARLHPLLVRSFLITFLNPEININKAQLIFTSHDAWQLDGNGLRRDEIWFAEKNVEGVSSLYSLSDFVDESGTKIRKDSNYEKNYLLGRYGAIPSLKCFDMFGEE